MRVKDRVVQPDTLSWVKFTSTAWTHDHEGIFYNRYPQPKTLWEYYAKLCHFGNVEGTDAGTETDINLFQDLCYHSLGTKQSEEILCWRDSEHPAWQSSAKISDDNRYLLLSIRVGCDPVNRLYYYDLTNLSEDLIALKGSNFTLPHIKLVDNFDAQYQYVANDGPVFTFLTNRSAPRYKVTRVDINNPEVWSDVIPESTSDVLTVAKCVNKNQLLISYMQDVRHVLQVHDLQTGAFRCGIPLEFGTVSDTSGRREDSEIFINFTSRFRTKQVFVTSKDGTKVPMFIIFQRELVRDGNHPALLCGYGFFNISLTPCLSVSRLVLARHYGTVVAVANIRGGGEYGEEWHKAGSLRKKHNCFDVFISCAEFLINEGYTQSNKLCIEDGSNGGFLVAACINQRPELFGCALALVGVMDMLRFHKFTIGGFPNLIKYSPIHNVWRPWEKLKGVQYPPTLLLTADHDDRVVPLHSLKLLATLQYTLCTSSTKLHQTNPIIARIDRKAGHGAGRPTQKMIDEVTDAYSFLAKMIGATWIE
uniref:Prolyl endopeptidase n=1 Tax=Physcomitrium patens TaxID=3218 RepID=A0A7I4BIE6_PHYPA